MTGKFENTQGYTLYIEKNKYVSQFTSVHVIAVLLASARLLTRCIGINIFLQIEKKASFIFLRFIFDSYIKQKHALHWVYLDLSTSYLKMELSKAGFYLQFSLLCISTNFL